ncbi:uncharacterized protein TNCV_4292031 [Trichonephila clavipes]|uniref:Uncharacterized protein n=1 Tax=Trichonephila clavipes TaxID=2585209 RepID=A0A8X6V4G1_TRICX|nr:uncharacterized protein TNCV_4292031 [Trichonephila clavipes]
MLDGHIHRFVYETMTAVKYSKRGLKDLCSHLFKDAISPDFVIMDDNARHIELVQQVDEFLESEDIRRMARYCNDVTEKLQWPILVSIKIVSPRRTAKFEIPPPQLNTTWNVFTKTLANTENCYLPQATSTPEIESQVRELTSEILAAHAKASRPMTHSEPPYVQGELKHLFRERNRARKLWQFTKFPQHKTEINRIQNKIKRKVGQYRQQVWEEHLTSLDAEDGSLWGTARAFRKRASPSPLMASTASLSVTQTKPN